MLMPISQSSVAHIRLTVTDLERSREFYESVFGWPVAVEVPEHVDDRTRDKFELLFAGVVYGVGDTLIGLRPVDSDRYHEGRVGLDHLTFAVGTKNNLDDAVQLLDELGIAHGPIKDVGTGYLVQFRDPDNIALELTALK